MEKENYNNIQVSHSGKKVAFQEIPISGNYLDIAEELENMNLKGPNSMEVGSLVNYIFTERDKKKLPVLKEFFNHPYWFREFTGIYGVPESDDEISNGVIIEHNPKIKNRKILMNRKSLIERIKKNDPLVKFVPFGFKIGDQTPKEFEENAFVIAKYGKKCAHQLSKLASEFSIEGFKPKHLYAIMKKPMLCGIEGYNWGKQRINIFYGGGDGYIFPMNKKND